MKPLLMSTLLVIVLLVACTTQPGTPAQPMASNTDPASQAVPTAWMTTPVQETERGAAEAAEIRDLVENFGKRLQSVSLLAPDAAQEMQKQYSEFVSPPLLETWMNDVSKAPGRMVSSPWPDRIEVTNLTKAGPDRYEVNGLVVEITSTEVGSSEAAARIPVRIVVLREQGRWLITEYIITS
jgi:hypothetical protein